MLTHSTGLFLHFFHLAPFWNTETPQETPDRHTWHCWGPILHLTHTLLPHHHWFKKKKKKKPWATITHRQLCHSFVFQLSDNWKNKKTKNHLISSITGKLALKQVNLEVICTYQCLVNFQFFAQLEKHAINILRFSVLMFVPSAFRQIPNQYWWCS